MASTYATPDDLRIALTRDPQHPEGTAAELSDEALQQAIDAAQVTIDSRLAVRYAVPFTAPLPPEIGPIAIAIAAYLADLQYRQSVNTEAQDPVARRYQWATDLLSKLANGAASLSLTASSAGVFPVGPYEGQLFGLREFDLISERDRYIPYEVAHPRWPDYG